MLTRTLRALPLAVGLLLGAGCSTEGDSLETARVPAALADSTWLVEDIGGVGIAGGARATLSFHTDGRVAGSGGCNRYSGSLLISGEEGISFIDLASTLKACNPVVDAQERRFFEALAGTRSFRMADPDRHLVLLGATGTALMRLGQLGS